MLLNTIYKKSPIFLQHLMVSSYGYYWKRLRFGKAFQSEYRGFCQREFFSQAEWEHYTTLRLRALLLSAFQTVPYYKKAWQGIVTLEQLQTFTLKDLPSLPPLDKSIARDDPQSLLIGGKPLKNHKVFHTSGSTGTPIATYWLPEELQRSLALREARSCKFAGVSYTMPRATFSGRLVEPNPQSKGPYYRYNIAERQVYFSAFHLRPDTVKLYISALWRHNIQWITGYSNSIYHLAQMAVDQKIILPTLKAIITTSEKITDEMRQTIEGAFSTKVFEEYGAVEDLSYVCENEFGQKLISPDAGIIEIVDKKFNPVAIGEEGEVLVTGFIRPNQPAIRYRIGDLAIFSPETPKCGRHMPMLAEVIGRLEDALYGLDGQRIVRFHGIFVNQPFIQEGQIIQDQRDHIIVRIIPKDGFSNIDEINVIDRIHNRFTTKMRVTVEKVEHIERTKSGKFKAVINLLSPEEVSTSDNLYQP